MNDRLKTAFGQIQAEESLKNGTKAFLAQRMQGYAKRKTKKWQYGICAAVCLLFLLIGGRWLYFTPTVKIGIDINPSIELGVNRFDRVVSVNGRNDDGRALAHVLDIRYMNYTDALDAILGNKQIEALLSNDEVMTITVTESNGRQSSRLFSETESCMERHENTCCYLASPEEAAAAYEAGLPYGKYRVFLEIQLLNPDITVSEIRGMTMRELRDLLAELSGGRENDFPDSGCEPHGSENGHGNGCGNGQGKRQKRK